MDNNQGVTYTKHKHYEERSIMVKCTCRCEALEVSETIWNADPEDREFIITHWAMTGGEGLFAIIKDRIKTAWGILRYGKAYRSDIILSVEDITALRDALNTMVEVGDKG